MKMNWDRVNLDLLVPFIMIFIIMRLDIHQHLLSGLRYFIPSADRVYFVKPTVPKTPLHIDAVANIDKVIQYALVEVDASFQKKHLISLQPFHQFYKTLVLVTTCVIAIHFWYLTYHCLQPTAPHISWSIFLAVASMLLAIQSQWNILLLTGWRAFESKVALNFGIMSGFVCCVTMLIFDDVLGFSIPFLFDGMAAHFNVLLLHLSANPIQLNEYLFSKLLRVTVGVLFGGVTAALVVPVLRFSQIFISMQYGVDRLVATPLLRVLLWVDMLGPIVLAILLLPFTWNVLSSFKVLFVAPHVIRMIQCGVISALALIRLFIMKPLLQSMLDTTVRMVLTVVKLGNVNKETKPLLQEKLKVVGSYLAAGASQLLAFPALIVSAGILVQRLTPGGTGLCVLTRNAAGLDSTPILEATSAALVFDATAAAREQAVAPFLDQALHSFLMGTGLGGHSPSLYMTTFISRASFLYAIPPSIAMDLLVMLLAFACISQGLLYILAVFYWKRGLVSTSSETVNESTNVAKPADQKKDD